VQPLDGTPSCVRAVCSAAIRPCLPHASASLPACRFFTPALLPLPRTAALPPALGSTLLSVTRSTPGPLPSAPEPTRLSNSIIAPFSKNQHHTAPTPVLVCACLPQIHSIKRRHTCMPPRRRIAPQCAAWAQARERRSRARRASGPRRIAAPRFAPLSMPTRLPVSACISPVVGSSECHPAYHLLTT
jgi:hypothetical protein